MLIREKGLSPKSVKNIHGVLRRALEQAKKLGYLKENPLEAVIVPRVEKSRSKQRKTMTWYHSSRQSRALDMSLFFL